LRYCNGRANESQEQEATDSLVRSGLVTELQLDCILNTNENLTELTTTLKVNNVVLGTSWPKKSDLPRHLVFIVDDDCENLLTGQF
jgi:hypothetical protein